MWLKIIVDTNYMTNNWFLGRGSTITGMGYTFSNATGKTEKIFFIIPG